MIESRRAIIAPVMVTVHHPLEDLVEEVFLGDVAGQRIADLLDVVADRCQSSVLERRPLLRAPLIDIALQRTDRGGVVFWSIVTRFSPVRRGGGGSRAGGPFLAREATAEMERKELADVPAQGASFPGVGAPRLELHLEGFAAEMRALRD
jgi:hypothetical protein